MPVGTTVAIVSVSALLLAGGSFWAGRASAPDDVEHVATLVEAQSTQIDILGDQMEAVASAASRPVVIDAEIRDKLAEVPAACRKGDPEGLACALQSCWQFGQSTANRPECREIEKRYLASLQGCPDGE